SRTRGALSVLKTHNWEAACSPLSARPDSGPKPLLAPAAVELRGWQVVTLLPVGSLDDQEADIAPTWRPARGRGGRRRGSPRRRSCRLEPDHTFRNSVEFRDHAGLLSRRQVEKPLMAFPISLTPMISIEEVMITALLRASQVLSSSRRCWERPPIAK